MPSPRREIAYFCLRILSYFFQKEKCPGLDLRNPDGENFELKMGRILNLGGIFMGLSLCPRGGDEECETACMDMGRKVGRGKDRCRLAITWSGWMRS